MKKLIGFIFLALLLIVAGCGSDSSETSTESSGADDSNKDAKVLKAGIGLSEGHPQYKGLEKFKEIVEEKTNSSIEVELYPNGQLGDDRRMIELLQNGSLEVTVPSTAPLANFVPEFNIFNYPFLIPNADVADAVFESQVAKDLLGKLEDSNLKGFGYWEEGFYNISNNVRPIETVEDLKGIKIRTMENDILLDVFKELGANPTPMAFGEVYTALQQGVVDAQTNPLSQIYETKFHEVQDYVSATNDFYGVWVFLMSKTFYDSLTAEEQAAVEEAAVEAGKYQIQLSRDSEEEYKQLLIDEGIQFNEVSDEAKIEMRETIQPVLDKYSQDLDQDIVSEFYNVIEQANN